MDIEFQKETENLSEDARSALKEFINTGLPTDVEKKGNDLELLIDDNSSFRRVLILKNADGVPDCENCIYFYNLGIKFVPDENRYCLYGETENETDIAEPFSITFDDAEVKFEVYNAVEYKGFMENPWEYLSYIVSSVSYKAEVSEKLCNKQELELLLLIREINALECVIGQEHTNFYKFPNLIALTEKYGFNDITALLLKLEHILNPKKYSRVTSRIVIELCEVRCEPLWRELFDKVRVSQAEYPNKFELYCSDKILSRTRSDIQRLMEQHGFAGTYPDFIKVAPLKGIHFEESYGVTYFAGMKKEAVYHIRWFESLDEENNLEVQFLCGTDLSEKDKRAEDIYSCLFNGRGKRLFHTMHCYVRADGSDDDYKSDDLEQCVNIAVKKAELKKLSKAERKVYYGEILPFWSTFFTVFLVFGGFFAVFMTLGFMVIQVLATLLLDEADKLASLFMETPWWMVFIFCWIAFGGIMGIITILARRK